MKCTEVEKRVLDYLTGELEEDTGNRLKEHIKTCQRCADSLGVYKGILTEARKIKVSVPEDEFWALQLNEIYALKPRRISFLKPAVLIASLTLILSFLLVKITNNEKISTSPQNIEYALFLEKLPYPEEKILDMIDYVDDSSASEILNILFENGSVVYH